MIHILFSDFVEVYVILTPQKYSHYIIRRMKGPHFQFHMRTFCPMNIFKIFGKRGMFSQQVPIAHMWQCIASRDFIPRIVRKDSFKSHQMQKTTCAYNNCHALQAFPSFQPFVESYWFVQHATPNYVHSDWKPLSVLKVNALADWRVNISKCFPWNYACLFVKNII